MTPTASASNQLGGFESADACETLFARHPARLYLGRSMFPDNARDNLILDGRIPGLLLIVVVVVVTEATAP